LNGIFSPEIISETLFLVTLGLLAFHAGGLLSVPAFREKLISKEFGEESKESTLVTLQALRLIGWGLLAISAVPALLMLKDALAVSVTSGNIGYLGRPDIPQGSGATLNRVANFIIPGTIFLLAGSRGRRLNIRLSWVVALSFALTLFFVGTRQSGAMFLLAYAWVYHRTVRPIPKTILLGVGGLLLFIVFPVVAAFRNVTGAARLSFDAFLDTFYSIDNPIIASIAELGYSMITVAYTISRVPHYQDFLLGVSYLYSLSDVFPNPSSERRESLELGKWLIQTVDPVNANLGVYSFGYSFIAEAYANFGWLFGPLALGIMGFLLGKLVLWADKPADPARIAMVGAFTGFFLLFARGEAHHVVRPFVWYALIPYLGVCALRPLIRPKFYRRSRRFRSSEEHFEGASSRELNEL